MASAVADHLETFKCRAGKCYLVLQEWCYVGDDELSISSALTNLNGDYYSCSQSSTSTVHILPMILTYLTFNNHQAQLQMNKSLGYDPEGERQWQVPTMKLFFRVNDHSRTLTMSTQCILVFMMMMGLERLS